MLLLSACISEAPDRQEPHVLIQSILVFVLVPVVELWKGETSLEVHKT